MNMTALIIGGALELAIICVSLYGATALPPGASGGFTPGNQLTHSEGLRH